jgi:hypothetical protein
VVGTLTDVIAWVAKGSPYLKTFAIGLGTVAAAVLAYSVATSGATIATTAFSAAMALNPVGLAVAGFVALAGAIMMAKSALENYNEEKINGESTKIANLEQKKIIANALQAKKQGKGTYFRNVIGGFDESISQKEKELKEANENKKTITERYSGRERFAQLKLNDEKITVLTDTIDKMKRQKNSYLTQSEEKGLASKSKSDEMALKLKTSNSSVATAIVGKAPQHFHINIGNLVQDFVVNAQTVESTFEQVRDEVAKVLIGAVNDSQRIAGIA